MSVKASIKITQFETPAGSGSVGQFLVSYSTGGLRSLPPAFTGNVVQGHLWAISNPQPRADIAGWPTPITSSWSDAPDKQPYLLYRYRFGFGRDNRELFPTPVSSQPLNLGSFGHQWGNLDDASGFLMYNELAGVSSSTSVNNFATYFNGKIRNFGLSLSNLGRIQNFVSPTGDVTVEEYPFILFAEPEPFSEKNPVDTDVFIRLSNYTYPIASGTINLFLDDELQTGLDVDEFFGGLGGFNVNWPNTDLFDYGAQVNVRWVFYDTASPANRFIIRYPFYTVEDFSGPRVYSLTPAHGAVGVSVTGSVQFTLEDYENDVDITSMVVYVNGVRVVPGENGTIQLERLQNERGYTVVVTMFDPWLYGDLIPVAIFVNDTSANANSTFFSYSFNTLESTAPRLLGIDPPPCSVDVPVGADILFDVVDGGHGLDTSSIVVAVEETERGSEIQLIPIVHRDE